MVSRKDAKEMVDSLRLAYSAYHEYAEVDPNDFDYLDLNYYQRTYESLNAEGFDFLGDIEDLTLTKAYPKLRSFIRCLASANGTIMAGIYHVKPLGWFRVLSWFGLLKQTRALDLETEFTNGCFVCTSNAVQASMMTQPPEIAAEYYGNITEAAELLDIHKQRVAEYLEQTDDLGCVTIRSLRDGLESQDRMTVLKAEHRDGIQGGLLPEEMDKIAKGMARTGQDALKEMQRVEEYQEEQDNNLL